MHQIHHLPLAAALRRSNLHATTASGGAYSSERATTHLDVTREDVARAAEILAEVLVGAARAGSGRS